MKTFKHVGKLGDIVWALPFIKEMGGAETLYLYENDLKDFTLKDIEFIKPLLEFQSYIKDIKIWEQESINFDLSNFREPLSALGGNVLGSFFNLYSKSIPNKYMFDPWLECPSVEQTNNIIVSYRKYEMDDWERMFIPHNFYFDLLNKNLETTGLFVGTEEEHHLFNKTYRCNIPHKKVKNALELACLIKSSSMCVGNQSFPTVLAESLKKTLFLETWRGTDAHNFFRPNLFLTN